MRASSKSKLGADEAINYKQVDWLHEVLKLTDGRGADLIIEVAGDVTKSLQALRIGGRLSFVGVVSKQISPLTSPPIPRRPEWSIRSRQKPAQSKPRETHRQVLRESAYADLAGRRLSGHSVHPHPETRQGVRAWP